MSKFDILVKYIPIIQTDSIGEWVVDKENDGTLEHPWQHFRVTLKFTYKSQSPKVLFINAIDSNFN